MAQVQQRSIIESFRDAWKIPELKNRLIFVMFAFFLQVVAIHITVPGITGDPMRRLMETSAGAALGLLDLFSGGALKQFSIVAMGIFPYINASIIMQLLGVAVPSLERKLKEGGESGRREINRYTRWLTLGLSIFQAALVVLTLNKTVGLFEGMSPAAEVATGIQIVLVLTAGTMWQVWLGDAITERGIGNGVSLIIFANIMVRLPSQFATLVEFYRGNAVSLLQIIALIVTFVLTVAGVVAMVEAVRKVPVQYARRVVGGGKVTSGGATYLPIKVNAAGVMPIIFAMAVLALPQTAAGFAPGRLGDWFKSMANFLTPSLSWGGLVASLVYTVVIFFFTYFYTVVVMDIPQMSENLKKWNAYIPGIRPGKDTTTYLDRVIGRITFAGAFFLSILALLQFLMPSLLRIPAGAFSLYGGTSLLIVVGVALDTMRAIEAQLMMRHYEGFIK